MKQNIPYWQVAGFLVTSILGTLLHFLFDWTGGSVLAALFSAVNESIWEHMKLLYYPMFAFAILQYHIWGRERENFWCVKLIGTWAGRALIPVLYYTYSGIFGISVAWLNIAIFFLAAGVSYWLEYQCFQKCSACPIPSGIALGFLGLTGLIFTVFTFLTPHIPFFRDPITGTYGFQR